MSALELDPVFVKALKLLRSNHKDSASQLKTMLDEALQKKISGKSSSDVSSSKSSCKSEEDIVKKRESEKRHLEKVKQDITLLSETPSESKKPKHESPSRQEKDEKSKEREKEKEKFRKEKEQKEKEKRDKEKREKERAKQQVEKTEKVGKEAIELEKKEDYDAETDDESKGMDADDFAFDLGISCIVCRQFDVSSKNQLVECQECHKLYHQECHRPPVVDQDVTDPRFVWYCYRCSKKLTKMAQPKATSPVIPPKQSVSSSKHSKPETPQVAFLRQKEPKPSSKESSKHESSSKPLSGLASLAANLSKSSEQSKSTSKSSESFKAFAALKTDLAKSSLSSKSDISKTNLSSKSSKPSSLSSKSLSSSTVEKSASSSSREKPSSSSSESLTVSPTSAINALVADKRLQQMKKKAASKQQDQMKGHVR